MNVSPHCTFLRFRYIDADGSGDITITELVLGGHLTKSQAEELFEKCRRKKDAAISDKDTKRLKNHVTQWVASFFAC